MSLVWEYYPSGGGELLTALAYADHAHDDGTGVRPSVAYIARKTRQSERTVQRYLTQMGTISLVWTAGMMILRKADIGEFFAEFIRFILFFGLFLWLLRNGPIFALSIIQSLQRIGEQASGISSVTPSSIVDVGFMVWKQAVTNLSAWSPIDSFVGAALSAGIMVLLAVISINMLLLLVSAWMLMYGGIFFLGFGGSRWTSDMAINYYKTVLGVAVQLFTMILLIGIGNDLLTSFYGKMSKGTLNFEELGVMLIFCVSLLLLINRIPPLLAGIITGSSVGSAGGIGNFGAGTVIGAAMGAAGLAASAAGMAGAAAIGGAANIAGGASAIKAAFQAAQASMDSSNDMSSSIDSADGTSSDGASDSAGTSPFAQAAGFSSEIAKGVGSVAKDKAMQLAEGFQEKRSQTFGGRVASSIRANMQQKDTQAFSEDSLSGDNKHANDNDEVAQFVHRSSSPADTA